MQTNWYHVTLDPAVVKEGDMTDYGTVATSERAAKVLAFLDSKDKRWLHNSSSELYSEGGPRMSSTAIVLECCQGCGGIHPVQMMTKDLIQNKDMEVDEAIMCPDCVSIPR